MEESIQLDFTNFDLSYQGEENDGKCHENFLEIFDNFLDKDEPLTKLCGRMYTLPTIKTIGHVMSIKVSVWNPGPKYPGDRGSNFSRIIFLFAKFQNIWRNMG